MYKAICVVLAMALALVIGCSEEEENVIKCPKRGCNNRG